MLGSPEAAEPSDTTDITDAGVAQGLDDLLAGSEVFTKSHALRWNWLSNMYAGACKPPTVTQNRQPCSEKVSGQTTV